MNYWIIVPLAPFAAGLVSEGHAERYGPVLVDQYHLEVTASTTRDAAGRSLSVIIDKSAHTTTAIVTPLRNWSEYPFKYK
jgi:hypothetical protein